MNRPSEQDPPQRTLGDSRNGVAPAAALPNEAITPALDSAATGIGSASPLRKFAPHGLTPLLVPTAPSQSGAVVPVETTGRGGSPATHYERVRGASSSRSLSASAAPGGAPEPPSSPGGEEQALHNPSSYHNNSSRLRCRRVD